MQSAQAFGLWPATWRAQSVDDRARMMAHVLYNATREAYVAERIKAKASSGTGGQAGAAGIGKKTGINAYEAQKAAMRARAGLK